MSNYLQGDENDATTLPDDDDVLFDDEDFVDDVEERIEEVFADEDERIRDPDVTPETLEQSSESEESQDEEVTFPKKVPKKKSSVNLRRLSQEEIDSYTNCCADNESNELTTGDIFTNQESLDLDER